MDKMRHESENNSKYYLVHVTEATVFPAHDNPWARGTDDNAYEHIRKKTLVRKAFM